MKTALTLVHKGAMDIAAHSISSFARHFKGIYRLQVHDDGSLGEDDKKILIDAADGLTVEIIGPEERKKRISSKLESYPHTRTLLARGGYFTKLELPMFHEEPYFFFDSDVIWLRPVSNLEPSSARSAFSTEGWSWYFGITRDAFWIKEKTPRRVNSGLYSVSDPFPYERLERMLSEKMFDPTIPGNSDQEIMAFLYPSMDTYDPEDMKRSRVGKIYDLSTLESSALHFPGRMWKAHLDQIIRLAGEPARPCHTIRYAPSKPLTHFELFKMRSFMTLANSVIARQPIAWLRKLRKIFSRD